MNPVSLDRRVVDPVHIRHPILNFGDPHGADPVGQQLPWLLSASVGWLVQEDQIADCVLSRLRPGHIRLLLLSGVFFEFPADDIFGFLDLLEPLGAGCGGLPIWVRNVSTGVRMGIACIHHVKRGVLDC